MHNIDLKKYEIRTDMAIDLAEKNNKLYKQNTYIKDNINVSWITLDEKNNIGKKKGTYLTLEFSDITDDDAKKKVSLVFKEELNKMLSLKGYDKTKKVAVIGLGNARSTPDALGPFVSDKIIATKHFFDMNIDVDKNLSNVSTFSPGVTGQTGIETSDFVKGVVKEIKPDMLIIVDALASSSISRVNKSIQVSDSGISPGSGIGNKRKEISKDTIGIPVIVIGVPTVVDAAVIVKDTINYMMQNYAYNKKIQKSKMTKFINKPINYLGKDIDIGEDDKKNLLGLIGTLNSDELLNLTYEVLTPIGYNLMVTPKEVDFIIEKLSDIISYGINHVLHNL